MKPYIVLGVYKPERWNPTIVGLDLTRLTKSKGLIPHVDPAHGPNKLVKSWYSEKLHAEVHRRTANVTSAEDWHYDGDITPGSKPDCCLVLWSSNHPTEIQYQGKIFMPKPYEVVIFKNMSVKHRRPAGAPRVRWLFRQRVAVPSHINLP